MIPKLADLTRVDRPRERLLSRGAGALKDAELVALILGSGTRHLDALSAAAGLLNRRGLSGLSGLSFRQLRECRGIGSAKAAAVLAAVELGRRLFQKPAQSLPALDGPESVFRLARDLASYKKEHFIAFYLNAKNQVLKRETVSIGSLFANMVHPREVFAPALEACAAGVVVAHNHPSGDPEPSPEDRALTRRLAEAGKLLGVDLLDHVVVGSEGFMSFHARRWI